MRFNRTKTNLTKYASLPNFILNVIPNQQNLRQRSADNEQTPLFSSLRFDFLYHCDPPNELFFAFCICCCPVCCWTPCCCCCCCCTVTFDWLVCVIVVGAITRAYTAAPVVFSPAGVGITFRPCNVLILSSWLGKIIGCWPDWLAPAVCLPNTTFPPALTFTPTLLPPPLLARTIGLPANWAVTIRTVCWPGVWGCDWADCCAWGDWELTIIFGWPDELWAWDTTWRIISLLMTSFFFIFQHYLIITFCFIVEVTWYCVCMTLFPCLANWLAWAAVVAIFSPFCANRLSTEISWPVPALVSTLAKTFCCCCCCCCGDCWICTAIGLPPIWAIILCIPEPCRVCCCGFAVTTRCWIWGWDCWAWDWDVDAEGDCLIKIVWPWRPWPVSSDFICPELTVQKKFKLKT